VKHHPRDSRTLCRALRYDNQRVSSRIQDDTDRRRWLVFDGGRRLWGRSCLCLAWRSRVVYWRRSCAS